MVGEELEWWARERGAWGESEVRLDLLEVGFGEAHGCVQFEGTKRESLQPAVESIRLTSGSN